jgi:WD40 repeat protein
VNTDDVAPYKGLSPFQDSEQDVRFFFGRDRERELIEANLMASRLTVLYGETGVGKSSVLRAGVAHHLRRRAAANLAARSEPGFAVVVFDQWRDDPVQGLRRAVAEEVTLALGGSVTPPDEERPLGDAFALWQELLDGDLYVILDQAEEYFLYHGGEEGPGTFALDFPAVVTSADLRVNFLLAIREDALAKLDVFRARIPNVLSNYLRLEQLDPRAARAAIVEPISEYNRLVGEAEQVEIDPELVDAVLEQVVAGKVEVGQAGRGAVERANGTVRIETAYLQLVMRRLWDEERDAGSPNLRLETLLRLGGAERIVQDHVVRALDELTGDEKDSVARLVDHLVTPSGTKIAHSVVDLAKYAGSTEADLLPVLTKLGNERILRSVGSDGARGSRYEIFHDVLAEPVLAWRAGHETTRALEAAAELTRRRHRRLAVTTSLSLIALVLMALLTVYAFSQRSESRTREQMAKSRELAASALTQIGIDPELSLLLAVKAATVEQNPSVDTVIRTALLDSRVRRTTSLGRPVRAIGTAPGGRLVVATDRATLVLDTRLHHLRRLPLAGRFLGARGDDVEFLTKRGLEFRAIADGRLRRLIPIRAGASLAVRNLETGLVVGHVHMPRQVRLAAVGPRGTLLAASDGSRRVVVVSARTGDARYDLVQGSDVTAVAFGPGARLLATGGRDGTTRLWTVATGKTRAVLRGHVGAVRDLAFSPRATLLATASNDGTTRVFRLPGNAATAVMSGHSNPVTDVAFSPDGTRIATASADGTARVWKAETGAQLLVLRGHRGAVTAVRFVGDGSYVVTGSDDRSVRLWYTLAEPRLRLIAQLSRPIVRAAFVSEDRVEAVTDDGRAHLLDRSGREVAERVAPPLSPARSVDGAVVTPTNELARIREPDGRQVVLRGHTRPVTSARFSPDGSYVVTASRDTTARIWDARTGATIHTLRGHFGIVRDASFSPDGRWVVTAGPGTAGLWQAESGELILYLSGHTGALTSASFDATGTRILTSGVDGSVRTYDCEICRGGPALVAVAGRRLERTGRTLTPAERARFLP